MIDNLDTKYERQSFTPVFDPSSDWYIEIDKTQLRWESYVKAGYYVCIYTVSFTVCLLACFFCKGGLNFLIEGRP